MLDPTTVTFSYFSQTKDSRQVFFRDAFSRLKTTGVLKLQHVLSELKVVR